MACILAIQRDLNTARSVMVSPDSLNAVGCQMMHGSMGCGRLVASLGDLDCVSQKMLYLFLKTVFSRSMWEDFHHPPAWYFQKEQEVIEDQDLLMESKLLPPQGRVSRVSRVLYLALRISADPGTLLWDASKMRFIPSTSQKSSHTSPGLTSSQRLRPRKSSASHDHVDRSNIVAAPRTSAPSRNASSHSMMTHLSRPTMSKSTIDDITVPIVELGSRRNERWQGTYWSDINRDASRHVRFRDAHMRLKDLRGRRRCRNIYSAYIDRAKSPALMLRRSVIYLRCCLLAKHQRTLNT